MEDESRNAISAAVSLQRMVFEVQLSSLHAVARDFMAHTGADPLSASLSSPSSYHAPVTQVWKDEFLNAGAKSIVRSRKRKWVHGIRTEDDDCNEDESIGNIPDVVPDEAEMKLVPLLDGKGGLAHVSEVEVYMPLMVKAATVEKRALFLSVLKATTSNACLAHFVEAGGLQVLKHWIKDAADNSRTELVRCAVEAVKYLPVTEETVRGSEIGRMLKKLKKASGKKAPDPEVVRLVDDVIARWTEVLERQQEERKRLKGLGKWQDTQERGGLRRLIEIRDEIGLGYSASDKGGDTSGSERGDGAYLTNKLHCYPETSDGRRKDLLGDLLSGWASGDTQEMRRRCGSAPPFLHVGDPVDNATPGTLDQLYAQGKLRKVDTWDRYDKSRAGQGEWERDWDRDRDRDRLQGQDNMLAADDWGWGSESTPLPMLEAKVSGTSVTGGLPKENGDVFREGDDRVRGEGVQGQGQGPELFSRVEDGFAGGFSTRNGGTDRDRDRAETLSIGSASSLPTIESFSMTLDRRPKSNKSKWPNKKVSWADYEGQLLRHIRIFTVAEMEPEVELLVNAPAGMGGEAWQELAKREREHEREMLRKEREEAAKARADELEQQRLAQLRMAPTIRWSRPNALVLSRSYYHVSTEQGANTAACRERKRNESTREVIFLSEADIPPSPMSPRPESRDEENQLQEDERHMMSRNAPGEVQIIPLEGYSLGFSRHGDDRLPPLLKSVDPSVVQVLLENRYLLAGLILPNGLLDELGLRNLVTSVKSDLESGGHWRYRVGGRSSEEHLTRVTSRRRRAEA